MFESFVTPWTIPLQAPLFMGFPRQKYWNGLPLPTPRDLPDSGIEPTSFASPVLAGGFFTTNTSWEALDSSSSPILPQRTQNFYVKQLILKVLVNVIVFL